MNDHYLILFKRIYEPIQKYQINDAHGKYNVFRVLKIEEKEVLMTRFLADLLNPKGLHGQGSLFLNIFINNLRDEGDSIGGGNIELDSTVVEVEAHTDENRRIDILLINSEFIRIIEVKINADDQPYQLVDYYNSIANRYKDKNIKCIYLTPFGNVPWNLSITRDENKLSEDNLMCISFAKDIVGFLNDSLYRLKPGLVYFTIEQYRDAIISFADEAYIEMINEFDDIVLGCEKNYECALSIYNYLSYHSPAVKYGELTYNSIIKGFNDLLECEDLKFVLDKLSNDNLKGMYRVKKRPDGIELNNGECIYFKISQSDGEFPCSCGFMLGPENLTCEKDLECFYEKTFKHISRKDKEKYRPFYKEECIREWSGWLWLSWWLLPSSDIKYNKNINDYDDPVFAKAGITLNTAAKTLLCCDKRKENVKKYVKKSVEACLKVCNDILDLNIDVDKVFERCMKDHDSESDE